VVFSASTELVARLEAFTERLIKANPGIRFGRSDAIRTLLIRALDAADRDNAGQPELPLKESPTTKKS